MTEYYTLPETTPEELVAASLATFKMYVDEDVRKPVDVIESGEPNAAALRSPLVVDRWIIMLTKMKRDSETQLANYDPKVDPRPPKEAIKWKAGVLRFRNGVEDRLAEAKSLRRFGNFDRLRHAVAEHRATVLADPDLIDVANKELWDNL